MNPHISSAYLTLILVWSTTALGIKWAVMGLPFSLALLGRFGLAALLALSVLAWRRQSLPLQRSDLRVYVIAGSASALSMLGTFWAAQYISSGMVAVVYGLIPLATAMFSRWILKTPLQTLEYLAIAVGFSGLIVIFGQKLSLTPEGFYGLGALLLSAIVQSGAAVLLKVHAQGQSPVAVNAGALTIGTAICALIWWLSGAPLIDALPLRSAAAVVYLASLGSVLAFSLYYWLIRECRPISVALISLITPVTSLWLGNVLNHEAFHRDELIGTGLILFGLLIYGLAIHHKKP